MTILELTRGNTLELTLKNKHFRIITNERLIAVNQDSLGVQGQCVKVI